jgi:RNA polymerase sigma-70 factor (ECF subfamily)
VLQRAALKAFQSWDRSGDVASRGLWFRRIVVNQARDHWRREATLGKLKAWLARSPRNTSRDIRDPLLPGRLRRALASLTLPQREAFVLVHLYEHTVHEVAMMTGRAPGTIKSHLHRALRALRQELADYGAERAVLPKKEVG